MPDGQSRYKFAGFVLDVAERRLHADGRDVYLPPRTFETLLYLVQRPGHLVPKSELLDAVWPGVAVTENALTRCIKEVRAALGDEAQAPRCIETVPRVGYRFIAPVEIEPEEVVHPLSQTDQVREAATASADGVAKGDGAEEPLAVQGASVLKGAVPPLPGAPAPRGWGRHLVKLLALAGLIVLVPIGSYLATPPGRTMGFGARDFVLVADLDNQSGEPLFDRSLMTAFTSLLEQSRYTNVYPRAGAVSALQRMGKPKDHAVDEDTGREICQREHVRGLVATSIARVGATYAFTARLIDPLSGRVVRSRVEYAESRDEVLDAMRRVAAALRGDLGESLSTIQTSDRPLHQVTTPSLDALKLYSDGMALWDKGEYKAAVQLYLDAIAKDPGFAAAHAALGSAYYSFVFADRDKGKAHFERALALVDRTNDRELRSIRASYAYQRGHWQEAADLYKAYLQGYPDDFRARHTYAAALRQLARYDEAAVQYDQVLRLAPNYASAHVNIATCYNPLGRFADALRHYDRAFDIEPSWILTPNINHEYGFVLVRSGDVAKARATFERAVDSPAKPTALRSLAMLDMYEGKYRAAAARLNDALGLSAPAAGGVGEARNRLFLATALEAQGKPADARRELGLAAKAAQQARAGPWVFCRIGAVMARQGMSTDAARLLELVRPRVDGDSPEQAADVHRLEGEIALARGDRASAIASLAQARGDVGSAFAVESLAHAHRVAGHRDEAIRLYEQLIGMKSVATGFEPQQGWLEAHYWLASLRAEAGDAAGAAKSADELLALWRDADADLPLLAKLRPLRAAQVPAAGR